MAEPSSHGKQAAKRLIPSRLKNQVNPNSTDDGEERSSEASPVQVPDSQSVVAETQLEHHPKNGPLSPSSAAVLNRNAVKMSAETLKPAPFAVKLFSKESLVIASSSAPASSFGFSFGQPSKPVSKIPLKIEAPPTQPKTEPSAVVQSSTSDQSPVVSSKSFPFPVTAHVVPKHIPVAGDTVTVVARAPTSNIAIITGQAEDCSGDQRYLCNTLSDVPTSAQPDHGNLPRPKKIQRVKKSKKGKKTINGKPRGVPWPPRSSPESVATVELAPGNDTAIRERSPKCMASPLTEQETARTSQGVNEGVHTVETNHKELQQTLKCANFQAEELIAQHHQLDCQEIEAVLSIEQGPMTSDASPALASQPAPGVLHPQFDQSLLPFDSNYTVNSAAHVPEIMFDRAMSHDRRLLLAAARPKIQGTTLPQPTQIGTQQHHITLPESQPSQPSKAGARKPLPDESVLHTVVNHSQNNRVEKLQRKPRTTTSTQQAISSALFRTHGPTKQDDFDKTLEGLREAHYADRHRKDQAMTAQSNHFEEVKALLYDQIQQYSVIVTGWEKKYNDLSSSTLRLRQKAQTNQKYVTGLQIDHEKLQKSALHFQDDCKKALQQKIAEVEHEKESLRRELETTLDSLRKSQRTLKGTVDELYIRLVISESKRRSLVESLAKQISMYEEEKTRRQDLETKLLPSFRSMQLQIGGCSTQLFTKLESLKASVDGVASGLGQDSRVQECLDALRKLQDPHILTSKDVQKAEGMLRSVYGGLCSKFDGLMQSVENKTNHTENFQDLVCKQLQDLRSEILKFDELAVERRKALDSNDTLSHQLKAERHHTQKLNEKFESARSNEEQLTIRLSQLEDQLAAVSGAVHSLDTTPPDPRQEAENLREKIKELRDECCIANNEVGRLQQIIQESDRKLVENNASVGLLQEECRRLSEQLKQEARPLNMVRLRQEVENDLEQSFVDKESGYNSEIHRLTRERNELQALVEQQNGEINAAKASCEEAKRDVNDLSSELEIIRKEKAEMETRRKSLHHAAQGQINGVSEISNLKEQLRQKSEEMRSKVAELESALAQSESHRADLQVEWEQQQTEISRHSSATESLRQEAGVERQEEQEKTHATIQLAQNKILALKKEKDDLQAKLEQRHLSEVKLSKEQAALIFERDELHHLNAELVATNEKSAIQLLHMKAEYATRMRKYEENSDTLRRRKEISDAALREAEAKIQLHKTEHMKKIQLDCERYETIIRSLKEEVERAKYGVASIHNSQQQPLQSPLPQDTFIREVQNINSGESMKRFNRGNNSVLNTLGTPGTLIEPFTRHANGDHRAPIRSHSDTLFDEDSHHQSISIIDAVPKQVEDTQEIFRNFLPPEDFAKQATHASFREPPRSNSTPSESSSLSASLRSDELTQLQKESQDTRRLSTPVSNGSRYDLDTQRSSQERVLETPTPSDRLSASRLSSSQSKAWPMSQANTASRLMPPPGRKSSHFRQRELSTVTQDKTDANHESRKVSHHISKASREKHSVKVHATRQTDNDWLDHALSLSESDHSHGSKRQKVFEQDASFKRQRKSSQSILTNPPSSAAPFRMRAPPLLPSVSPSLDSNPQNQHLLSNMSQRTTSGTSSPKKGHQARNQPSSSSRPTASTTAPHHYSSRQTRSKTQEAGHFEKETRGR